MARGQERSSLLTLEDEVLVVEGGRIRTATVIPDEVEEEEGVATVVMVF